MKRSPMPPRIVRLQRSSHLKVVRVDGAEVIPFRPRKPIKPVSDKRRAENRKRAAMADARWPDRREGAVLCAVWEAIQPDWCDRFASDLHEPLSRARGGDIADPEGCVPVCRNCHTIITDKEPDWAYEHGFLIHSWGPHGGAA